MIYTVTFNPALDYITDVPDFREGEINRSSGEKILSGGKGINVSIVLKNLGIDSTALGFIAGFTGDEIERGVRSFGCNTDFIRLDGGLSRINLKIRSKRETAVNGGGPPIPPEKVDELFLQLSSLSAEISLFSRAAFLPPCRPTPMRPSWNGCRKKRSALWWTPPGSCF